MLTISKLLVCPALMPVLVMRAQGGLQSWEGLKSSPLGLSFLRAVVLAPEIQMNPNTLEARAECLSPTPPGLPGQRRLHSQPLPATQEGTWARGRALAQGDTGTQGLQVSWLLPTSQ